MLENSEVRIGIIGLGYVGLPLAVEFSRLFPTVGFDINATRIASLQSGKDETLEVAAEALAEAKQLQFSSEVEDLRACNVYIVSVPTPINHVKWPDLTPLISASNSIAKVLEKDDIVIYESTVYPGATEEICVVALEQASGLKFNQDFFVGYSPERINPGDKQRPLTSIKKVTSGSMPAVADFIDQLYGQIITAGTYKAASIRVAEAAKVIENTQRDVNIAFVNELAVIFDRLGIDTEEVLEAAATKWNFLPFRPGLVGGHCIGVDPYYLSHKALETGYQPTIIPASRLLNERMGEYVADRLMRLMAQNGICVVGGSVLVMGFSFKENCPDLRNTRVIDIVHHLRDYHAHVEVFDPWVDKTEAKHEYDIDLIEYPKPRAYDAILLAVAHKEFAELGAERIRAFGKPLHVLFDVKYVLDKRKVDGRL